jgi:hypothetical protein
MLGEIADEEPDHVYRRSMTPSHFRPRSSSEMRRLLRSIFSISASMRAASSCRSGGQVSTQSRISFTCSFIISTFYHVARSRCTGQTTVISSNLANLSPPYRNKGSRVFIVCSTYFPSQMQAPPNGKILPAMESDDAAGKMSPSKGGRCGASAVSSNTEM